MPSINQLDPCRLRPGPEEQCGGARGAVSISDVADWRLDDDAFRASFRLPTCREKYEFLARMHPHVRDDRIIFEEEAHKYFVDGAEIPCSVTTMLKEYEHSFDADAVLMNMRRDRREGERYRLPDGRLQTDEEVKAMWHRNGQVASNRGTLLHYHAEQHLNNRLVSPPHSVEFGQFLVYERDEICAGGYVPWRTEFSMFSEEMRIAGQADLIAYNERTGTYAIFDWKCSKEISYHNRFNNMKPPLSHLTGCNFNKYALQLNIYKYILESEYGLTIEEMFLGVFHKTQQAVSGEFYYQHLPVPCLDAEVASLVAIARVRVWIDQDLECCIQEHEGREEDKAEIHEEYLEKYFAALAELCPRTGCRSGDEGEDASDARLQNELDRAVADYEREHDAAVLHVTEQDATAAEAHEVIMNEWAASLATTVRDDALAIQYTHFCFTCQKFYRFQACPFVQRPALCCCGKSQCSSCYRMQCSCGSRLCESQAAARAGARTMQKSPPTRIYPRKI